MTVPAIEDTPLVGGNLCLDFVNTTGSRGSERPRERLRSYRDLLVWSRRVSLIEPDEEKELARHASSRPAEAGHVLGQALRIRELLYRLLVSTVTRQEPAAGDIDELNRLIVVSAARRRLESGTGTGLVWTWDGDSVRVDGMIWPVVHSAAGLLSSADLKSLKRCGECGWLFLDATKNRSRLWCKKACGDRVKARRYYARHKVAL